MSLSGLLPLLHENERYTQLLAQVDRALREQSAVSAASLPSAAVPYLLATLQDDLAGHATPHRIVVITARPERARAIYEGLLTYAGEGSRVAHLPTPDLIPYERIGWDSSLTSGRLAALQALTEDSASGPPLIVVGAVRAMMQPTMPPADFRSALINLQPGQPFDLNRSLSAWLGMGYQPAALVEQIGQFSRRGGIVDLWPATLEAPIRIELLGDEIESLRRFDPTTQRSNDQVERIVIAPACEIPFWRRNAAVQALSELDLRDLRTEVREEWQDMLDTFREGECFEGMELFLPYFSYGQPIPTALDYLQPGDLIMLDRADGLRMVAAEVDNQAAEQRRALTAQRELPPNLLLPYVPWPELEQRAALYTRLEIGESAEDDLHPFAEPTELPLPAPAAGTGDNPPPLKQGGVGEGVSEALLPANSYAGRIDRLVDELRVMSGRGIRVVIVSQQAARLREMLEEQEVYPVVRKVAAGKGGATANDELTTPPDAGSIHLLHGVIVGGWQLDYPATVLLTDTEVFGWTPPVRRASRRTSSEAEARTRNAFVSQLEAGQYIVHIEHGIGRFGGLVMRQTDGIEREYMLLEYADGDRLYVPSEQTDRVLSYSGAGHQQPTLNRLGTAEWSRTKRKVRESTEQLARELLTLYSQREVAERPAYGPDTPWQQEMESSFPYVETEDQMRAIEEVKADMVEDEPMDRLVCGDVGYGKTEVAMRAAFKVVMSGKQVAVLVPTTLLAQQHYDSFRQRMGMFPVEIEMISRFRNRKQQQDIVERLRHGKVDILIGTHRLLQKDVNFKNLGMIVVDEEQRFGVKHKEQLKQLRTAVDVLTLTATPIPRTLHMAMVGVRDMSVIETPPADRLPIKTYVTAYNDQLVREVILRELQRGGQIFFVHNRVIGMSIVLQNLQKLVPEARIGVGHGQMNEEQLEKVMEDFIHKDIDVLLCTTIIESGLDIPNANTLIVDEADNFGLAQLYQLRGRVGRGANRAYAYFLYHKGQHLTEEAQERLQAIQEATELGAGFRVALRDLEIRGAGNLLGAEQSGHIGSVGFDLYTRLLANAVDRARKLQSFATHGKLGNDTGHASPDEVEGQVELAAEANLDDEPLTIDLPLSAFLPTDYVSDDSLRLRLYQRLARPLSPLQSKEVAKELEDRFGELPTPARNLLFIVQIKGMAMRAGAEAVSSNESEIAIRFSERATAGGRLAALNLSRVARRFGNALRVGPRMVRLNRRELGERWPDALKAVLEELNRSSGNEV